MRFRATALALTLCLVAANPAIAGVEAGTAADVEGAWKAYLDGDYSTALSGLTSASEAGDRTAQYYLGVLFSHGEAVARDYRTAARWYEKAAAQDHTDAQFNLGLLHYGGSGAPGSSTAVARDTEKAAGWFEKAADNGHPMAAYLLCKLIDDGRSAPRDLDRALNLCRAAADSGIVGAQFTTGLLLAESSNEIASWQEAYTWFYLAERENYPGAQQNLAAVARYLEAADVAAAQAAAKAWQPKAQPAI